MKTGRTLSPLVACMILMTPGACRSQKADGENAGSVASPASAEIRPPATPDGPRVYVSNEDSNDVSIVDSKTNVVLGTIFVGKRPRGIRLSPDNKTLYVALSGSPKAPPNTRDAGDAEAPLPADRSADGIAVVDAEKGALVRVIESGQDPESFDLMPDGKTMYVSNEESGQASVVDLVAARVTGTIKLADEPEGVRVKPAGDAVYITSEAANKVFAVDTKTNAVKAVISTGARPRGVVFTPDGALAFITEEQGGSVTVVDAVLHKAIDQIKIETPGARPMGAAMAPDGKTAYVTTGRGGSIVYIDTATHHVVKAIDHVGARPWGVGVSPDGKTLYAANGPSNDVAVIDVATGDIVARVKAGKLPWGIAVGR